MRESFPNFEVGDRLTVGVMNRFARVAERVSHSGFGSFQSGRSHNVNVSIPPEPYIGRQIKITSVIDDTKGTYNGRIFAYNSTDEEWTLHDDDQLIDVRSYGPGLVLLVNDIIRCEWDSQRGAFIPNNPPLMRACKPDDNIEPDQSGLVTLYKKSSSDDTIVATTTKVTAHLRWMHENTRITAGSESVIQYFIENGRYEFVNAECSSV